VAKETRELRRDLLRPHQEVHELVYDGDDWSDSAHFVALQNDVAVGIASIYPQGRDGAHDEKTWRLRGMATADSVRGSGVGRLLLEATICHARASGAQRYWCNARVPAQGFYEHHGMRVVSEVFVPPGLGPHVVMEMEV
jgi:predicted GNAT family N-acyltransferase